MKFQTTLSTEHHRELRRRIDAGVISVTMIHAGGATNVIPDSCELQGTVRTFTLEVLDLIEQVLVNLLKNGAESVDSAQRPTARRSVVLRVVPKRVDDRPVVEFSVQDSGKGLAPEVMARLYEAFFSTKTDGMGIGLSLCRSIVESHQGRMKAENIYNGSDVTGCCFSFWLPLSEPSPALPPVQRQQTRTPG